ncbi:MAG: hypothetical protein ACRD26_19930 [Vicinamibacterales bacterium]
MRIAGGGPPDTAWAEGLTVAVPNALLEATGLARAVDARGDLRLPGDLPPIDPRFAEELRMRSAFTPHPPASSRLPFSYRFVPGPLRRAVASAIGRRHRRQVDRWAAFPGWPLDLSADLLQDLASPGAGARAASPTPVILTHDIDSPDGLRSLAGAFLPIEESCGARSTSYVVPCAWPLDEGLLREVRDRGHELGIHGYDHANRTPFAAAAERLARLDAARPLAERFGMSGYRAPSLLRTRALLEDLAPRYRYDSSVPTSGGLFPVPNNGCASARPFRIGGLLEIPITLPRDGSLRFLGHTPDEILRTWQACAGLVARSGGVVVLLTHCERHFSGNAAMLNAYRAFLEWAHGNARFTFGTPAGVLARA